MLCIRSSLGAFLLALCLLLSGPGFAKAAEVEERWRAVDESGSDLAETEQQARASIYRGDHLLAVRCHRQDEETWLTLVFSATWFVRPKEQPRFSVSVDERAPVELSFQRETDYRFAAADPPRRLLEQLAAGSEATVAGPDYEGTPVALPLNGSRRAINQALTLCDLETMPASG
ncbi:MAG: hypothetical protein AAFY02_02435 [Pseudomonadota bacterium]